jgi:ankyrin repeat protein
MAAKDGDTATVRHYIDIGSDVNLHNPSDEGTPLSYAVWGNQLMIAQLLLHHGANANAWDDFGFTPVHDAAMYGHLDILKLLIEYKGDIAKPNGFGDLPLHVAVMEDHLDVVRFLLDHGADVNAETKKDGTALDITRNEAIRQELRSRGGKSTRS